MCTDQYYCVLLWCGLPTGEAEEAQLFVSSSPSSLFLPFFLLSVLQPFGCVKTPWIIYTPTATSVTNAKKVGGKWGEKEARTTATNKQLKGEGNETPPCWLIAIIHHMRGHSAAVKQVMTQFLAHYHHKLTPHPYMTTYFRYFCVTESSLERFSPMCPNLLPQFSDKG